MFINCPYLNSLVMYRVAYITIVYAYFFGEGKFGALESSLRYLLDNRYLKVMNFG
ncbi:protein of unknown function [Vibrio tapetis subsp. tapetis]|uniref:Uncharacterized protein n=1 Tax=Vibrio tapetis subsp. tapetis TaxID=1671868 RepID=A0A2N8ZA92_9VIBR|nr:protein of unknown function [Vibrio tapetis subsp. tapetis]